MSCTVHHLLIERGVKARELGHSIMEGNMKKPPIQRLEALIVDLRKASEGISAFGRAWQDSDDVSALLNLSNDLDIIASDLDNWINES